MLADSNVLIYAVNNINVANWLMAELPAISAVTMLETLGYHRLTSEEQVALEKFMQALRIIYPTVVTFQVAITLRQNRRMSVADALIAATAIEYGLTLATHNTADFESVDKLLLFDPVPGSVG